MHLHYPTDSRIYSLYFVIPIPLLATNKIILSLGISGICSSFLLTSSVVPKLQDSFSESQSEASYAELPDSSAIFTKELRKQNDALRDCKGRESCVLLMAYTEVLRSHLDTLENNSEEFSYIRQRYGTGVYNWIIENRPTIELKFDEYLTQEILAITNGKVLSKDNGFTEKEVFEIYRDYVFQTGFEKLDKQRMNAKTPQMRVLYDFQIFLLFTDRRLYQLD